METRPADGIGSPSRACGKAANETVSGDSVSLNAGSVISGVAKVNRATTPNITNHTNERELFTAPLIPLSITCGKALVNEMERNSGRVVWKAVFFLGRRNDGEKSRESFLYATAKMFLFRNSFRNFPFGSYRRHNSTNSGSFS